MNKNIESTFPVSFLALKSSKGDGNKLMYKGTIAAAVMTAGALYVGKALLTNYLESHLFRPKDNNHKPLKTPDKYGLDGFTKKLDTGDGDEIEIWHLKGDKNKPAVVFQHGNTGNLSYVSLDSKHQAKDTAFRIEYLKKLQERGIETIAVSSRGFGNSKGKPSEANFKRDAQVVADYLEEQGIKPERTIVNGESLGTSTATILVEEMSSRGKMPAVLTLVAPFTSLRKQIYESSQAPNWLVDAALNHPLDTDERLKQIANTAKEKNLKPPHLLVVSPSEDAVINPQHGNELVRTAQSHEIPTTQQHQQASHVNWDAAEVIDATLEIYSKRNDLTSKNHQSNIRAISSLGRLCDSSNNVFGFRK